MIKKILFLFFLPSLCFSTSYVVLNNCIAKNADFSMCANCSRGELVNLFKAKIAIAISNANNCCLFDLFKINNGSYY